jgi:hypothetical protein
MTLMDYAKANVRTIVPYLVGLVITLGARHGIKLDAQETAALSVAVGAVYYIVVRALERYVTPKFGWLLGLAQQPVYAKIRSRKDQPLVTREVAERAVRIALTHGQGHSAHARLHLLPKPTGRKGGMLPSPRDDRDYKAKLPSKIPASVDNGKGITWGMLLNAQLGDCYEAALLHALQVLTGYTPVDADALAIYEQVTGYDPTRTDANGNNPTDQGTYGRQLFDWARAKGLITSYAAVPPNRQAVKAAIAAHKVVLCEWALPTGAETEGDVWTMPRSGRTAGSWGGHATVEPGYTPERNRNVTWGEEGTVTPAFEDAYLQAAWVITVAPGTNVAAIMAKVRAA